MGEPATIRVVVADDHALIRTGIATLLDSLDDLELVGDAADGEALLAVLSIVTWHFYNVHVKSFNKSMFSGSLSHHEMEEEHPLELAALETTQVKPIAPAVLRQRQRVYLPAAVIFSLVLLVSVYFFVTFESTAITTVPRQTIEVFVPAD